MADSRTTYDLAAEGGPSDMVADAGRRRRIPAWLMSCVLHVSIVLLLAMTLRVEPPRGGGEPDRTAGIVLARQVRDSTEYFDGEEDASPLQAASRQSTQSTTNPLPSELDAEIVPTGALPSADESIGSGGSGDFLPDAGQATQGAGANKGIGGKAKTYVFGTLGEGTKFVYVFDRSGSMDGYGGRPLRAAKKELVASLADLGDVHQFQIIFYNERPQIFNPSGGTPRLIFGDARGKSLAGRFVGGITAAGGTRHTAALKLALGMRPDVIFFLTDADEPRLSPDELAMLRRMNRGTTINTIEFGFGPFSGDDNFLVRLARQNYGQHAYVDISQLSR